MKKETAINNVFGDMSDFPILSQVLRSQLRRCQ